jgi:hypothetical protein
MQKACVLTALASNQEPRNTSTDQIGERRSGELSDKGYKQAAHHIDVGDMEAHQVHARGLEFEVGARADEDALAEAFKALPLDEFSDGVVINTRAQGPEKVDGLVGERVHKNLDLATVEVVIFKDAEAHANAVLPGWIPVVLLHPAITDEWCVKSAEVVSCIGQDVQSRGLTRQIVWG